MKGNSLFWAALIVILALAVNHVLNNRRGLRAEREILKRSARGAGRE